MMCVHSKKVSRARLGLACSRPSGSLPPTVTLPGSPEFEHDFAAAQLCR